MNTLESLEWDSQFFGYPTAKIYLDQDGYDKVDNLFLELKSGKFRLTYVFVSPQEKELNKLVVSNGAKLVDQKVVFSKQTQKHDKFSNLVTEIQEADINDKLINLVLQTGIYSRYSIDKDFKNGEYEKLYIEWLKKSVDKTIAFKTLGVRDGSDVIGLITLAKKPEFASIGLLVVDEKYRGKGIGYDLISAAETIAFESGFKEIKVATQLENKNSCKFYERANFKIESIENIYHYWQ